MKPCKICNQPQSGGYIICGECAEIAEGIPVERLKEICQAERDGRCVVQKKRADKSHCKMCGISTGKSQFCSSACKMKYYRHNTWNMSKRYNAAKSTLEQEERHV